MMTYINFPKRIAKIQQELERRKIDILVGTRLKTCVHYSGGFVPWRSACIIPQKGDLQLITPLLDAARLAEESFLENVAGYGALPGIDYIDMIANRINELGCSEKTIGIESGTTNYLPEGYITLAEYEALKSRFPKATFVNAADVADRLTLIKEPEEIKLMRQATALTDAAHEIVLQNLKVGISEKEIAGIAEKAMRDRGSQFAWTFTGGCEIASGYRTWYHMGGCTPATDKIVQCGDPVMLDLHGMYWLFLGDVAHNAVMGKPTREQQEAIDAYVETCYTAFEEMKPGRTLKEVADKVYSLVIKNGWTEWILPGFGHGIGHLGNEWYPCVAQYESPGNNEPDFVLQPGYMQMMAIVCNRPGHIGLRLERPLVITENGSEVLSKLCVEPAIIDCPNGCRKLHKLS
ncbi:MAG: M24 family metallopeptidase [Bacillota bacterium]